MVPLLSGTYLTEWFFQSQKVPSPSESCPWDAGGHQRPVLSSKRSRQAGGADPTPLCEPTPAAGRSQSSWGCCRAEQRGRIAPSARRQCSGHIPLDLSSPPSNGACPSSLIRRDTTAQQDAVLVSNALPMASCLLFAARGGFTLQLGCSPASCCPKQQPDPFQRPACLCHLWQAQRRGSPSTGSFRNKLKEH